MSSNINTLTDEMKGRFEERTNMPSRITGLVCMAIGIALLAIALSHSANGGIVFVGGGVLGLTLSIYGGVKAAFGSTVLTDKTTGAVLESRSIYYAAGSKSEISSALENEEWRPLKSLAKNSCQQPLCLKAWYTKDGGYASAMLMEFVPYQYVPTGRLKEISREKIREFIEAIK